MEQPAETSPGKSVKESRNSNEPEIDAPSQSDEASLSPASIHLHPVDSADQYLSDLTTLERLSVEDNFQSSPSSNVQKLGVPEEPEGISPSPPPNTACDNSGHSSDGSTDTVDGAHDMPPAVCDSVGSSSNSPSRKRDIPNPASDVLHPHRISPESIRYVGAGLSNLGNSCFLNAILQCITHIVPLVEDLRSCGHGYPCEKSVDEFCIMCALHEQIETSLSARGSSMSPFKMFHNLHNISSYFEKFQQEDAHELMQSVLAKLEESYSSHLMITKQNCSEEKNLVREIFGGRLISTLRCCNCDRNSDIYEPFNDLSLEIDNVKSLKGALKSFTATETVGGPGSNLKCEGCNQEVFVDKRFLLDKSPPIAAFHLKRFKNEGSFVEKIDTFISYPLELDLKPFFLDRDQDGSKYELYGVVVHNGLSPNTGHYFCYLRGSPSSWFRFDDHEVTPTDEETVLSRNAYIVLYARKGTPWITTLTMKNSESSSSPSTSPRSVLEDVAGDRLAEIASAPPPPETAGEDDRKPNTSPSPICIPRCNSKHRLELRSESPLKASFSTAVLIHRNHLKSKKQITAAMADTGDDPKRKEAAKLAKKTMCGRRSTGLIAAMNSLSSTESPAKRRRRSISSENSPAGEDTSPTFSEKSMFPSFADRTR